MVYWANSLGKLAGNWMNNVSLFQAKHSINHLWVKDLNAKWNNKSVWKVLERLPSLTVEMLSKRLRRGLCTVVKVDLRGLEYPNGLWASYSIFQSLWNNRRMEATCQGVWISPCWDSQPTLLTGWDHWAPPQPARWKVLWNEDKINLWRTIPPHFQHGNNNKAHFMGLGTTCLTS